MTTPIRVFIAEDHPIVRQGLRALLGTMSGVTVVGESADGAEVVELVLQLDPDVVLLDILLPHLDGIEIVKLLTQRHSRARVLMLSMHDQEEWVLNALRSGAVGYVLKSSDLEDLHVAIRSVIAGHRFLSAPLADRAIEAYSSRTPEPSRLAAKDQGYELLTNRQREVLRLMADGYGNLQIGRILGISPRTAELHRSHVMHKLKLSSQTDVVRFALQRGLISLRK
ncbi:MAG TPA: response regulator transcription factor [Pseudomonadota bacterium]|nr:response regulator transcription factor [Pseudomonadota bacterium]